MKTSILFTLLAVPLLFASGCATKVQFTSDPPGAHIRYRGEGRAAFRWKTIPETTSYDAANPLVEKIYYGRITAYADWHDGKIDPETRKLTPVLSERQEINLSSFDDVVKVHFVMPK